MRMRAALRVLLGIACVPLAGCTGAQGPDEWRPLTIGDDEGYAMPADVVRSLGLPYEDIPDRENAATYYIEATNALPAVDPEEEGLSEPYDAALRAPWSLDDGEFSAWFRSTEEARRLFRKAAGMGRCRFPIVNDEPVEVPLSEVYQPGLSRMRALCRLMVMEGHLHEHEVRVPEALEAYIVILRAGRHVRRGYTHLDASVGIAMNNIAVGAVAECLARQDPDRDVLGELAGSLAALDSPVRDRANWIPYERVQFRQIAELPPSVWAEEDRLSKPERAYLDSRAFRVVWPDRTIARDYDGYFDEFERLAQLPTWEAAEDLQDFDDERWFKDWNVVALVLTPSSSRTVTYFITAGAHHDALAINVALRRFRADAGRYPESLVELVPDYLKVLPLDPFTGEPFRYRRRESGWLLYSLGPDLDDDGGAKGDRYDNGDIAYRSGGKEGQDQ